MSGQILTAVLMPANDRLLFALLMHFWWIPLVCGVALALGVVSVAVSAASGAFNRWLDGPDEDDDDILEQKRMECVIGFRRGR